MMINPKATISSWSRLLNLCGASLILTSTITITNAYDIGCIYPKAMPDPLRATYVMVNYATLKPQPETPIAIHHALVSAMCGVSCMASHDKHVLSPVTGVRPLLVAPEFGHNAYSIALCNLACHVGAVGYEWFQPLLERWNVNITGDFNPELAVLQEWREQGKEASTQEIIQLAGIVAKSDYNPILMGQLIIADIYQHYLKVDGWNDFGEQSYDFLSQSIVNCTANCMPYSDLSGYYPRNNPGRPYTEEEKYNVTGDDMYWQPLLEDDGKGYFSRQQHVMPHLAVTAKMNLDQSMMEKTIPAPKYDYRKEALKVVEALRLTAENQTRRAFIEVFDQKLVVRGMFESTLRKQFAEKHSYQMDLLMLLGLSWGDDDAVILSWKEKIRHDLVRPTTVIQRWGDDKLVTYSGDKTKMEAMEIPARNFEAYIRVMPHSEYPSGSACLCTNFREFIDAFTEYNYGGTIENIKFGGPDGHETNCNGEIGEDLPRGWCSDDYTFMLSDMKELEEICGQSRLWGGMHFTKSVPAGHELCSGLGSLALEKLNNITADTDFGGNPWHEGDPRPTCPDPAMDMTGPAPVDGSTSENSGDINSAGSFVRGSLVNGLVTSVAAMMALM